MKIRMLVIRLRKTSPIGCMVGWQTAQQQQAMEDHCVQQHAKPCSRPLEEAKQDRHCAVVKVAIPSLCKKPQECKRWAQ